MRQANPGPASSEQNNTASAHGTHQACGHVTVACAWGAAACGLGLATLTLLRAAALSFDAARYLELARAYADDGLRAALDWYVGPAFPVAVGTLYRLLGDLELAGRLFGLISAVALVGLVWLLLKEISDHTTAHFGAALLATNPAVIRHAPSAEIDLPYLMLLCGALYAQVRSIRSRQSRAVWSVSAGLLFGIAYLVRPEALVVALLVGLWFLVGPAARQLGARRWLVGLSAPIALMVGAPYLVWLHESLGRWTLSGKDRTLSLKYLPDKKHPERALQAGPIGAILQNPDDLFKWLPVHAKRTLTELPKAAGYGCLALAVLGAVAWHRGRVRPDRLGSLLVLIASVPPVLAFALLYPYERYFLQGLPAVALLAALGCRRLLERCGRRWVLTALLGINLLVASVQAREPLEQSRLPRRRLGERIAASMGPGRRALAFTVEAFYAGADRVPRWDPFEGIVPGHGFGRPWDYDRLLAFLRAERVEVIVVDEHFRKDCPEFYDRLQPTDFRLLFRQQRGGDVVDVFEVLAVTRDPHRRPLARYTSTNVTP